MQWRFLLFFLVFFGIIILANLYVWWRLTPLGPGWRWFFILVAVALGSFLMGVADRLFANGLAKGLYIVGMAYWGFLFLLVCCFVVTEPARFFLDPRVVTLFAFGLAALLSVIALVNGQTMVLKEVEIPIPHLTEEVRVVQLSDVHLGSVRGKAWLEKAVSLAKEEDPDLVAITGDLFDGSRIVSPETLAPLDSFGVPVFLSVGNHEVYDGVDKIAEVVARTKVRLLRNEVVDAGAIQVAGIDHPAQELRRDSPVARSIPLAEGKPAILLYHPPTGAEDAAAAGFSLQLSGHTHNGQLMPFNLLVKPFYPRIRGLYDVEGMKLYTSPGTGTWGPPMRLGSRNEVTLLRLVPAER